MRRRLLTTLLLVLVGFAAAIAVIAFFVSRDDGALDTGAAPAVVRLA